jgi:ribosomal protein S27AE
MKETNIHRLDLTKIDGNGDFPCPRCGTVISPDDSTEEKYSILYPRVNSKGLEEIVILCSNCGSQIYLTGFSLLLGIA